MKRYIQFPANMEKVTVWKLGVRILYSRYHHGTILRKISKIFLRTLKPHHDPIMAAERQYARDCPAASSNSTAELPLKECSLVMRYSVSAIFHKSKLLDSAPNHQNICPPWSSVGQVRRRKPGNLQSSMILAIILPSSPQCVAVSGRMS